MVAIEAIASLELPARALGWQPPTPEGALGMIRNELSATSVTVLFGRITSYLETPILSPDYAGPTRLVLQAYGDDVDPNNGLRM